MVVKQAHNYRADVPIKAGATTIVDVYTIPTVEIDYYTLQFGDAVDAKSDETGGAPDKVSRNDDGGMGVTFQTAVGDGPTSRGSRDLQLNSRGVTVTITLP